MLRHSCVGRTVAQGADSPSSVLLRLLRRRLREDAHGGDRSRRAVANDRGADRGRARRPCKLDYVFPSHHEIPHAGNLSRILEKYPEAVAVGDVTDYHLYFPEIDRARLVGTSAGDVLDLGDRSIEFLEPLFNDLSCTLWAYETTDSVLFCVDGLEYSHLHGPESCGLMSDEIDLPSDEIRSVLVFVIQPNVINTPMAPALDALRRLFERLRPAAVGPSHGAPIRGNLDVFIPWIIEEYAASGNDSEALGDVRVKWQGLLASNG